MSSEHMEGACRECDAPLSFGEACLSHFHSLLALEHNFPDAPGSILHFDAVAAYNLQHPDSAAYTLIALQGLRRCVGAPGSQSTARPASANGRVTSR